MKIEANTVNQKHKQNSHAYVQVTGFLPTTTFKMFDIHGREFRVTVLMKRNLTTYKNHI